MDSTTCRAARRRTHLGLWAAHDRRAPALRSTSGREIDRTDGFLLLFDAAPDALRYALATTRRSPRWRCRPVPACTSARSTLRENGPGRARGAKPIEVEGLAKPFAARVMALARGGQTLLSARPGPRSVTRCPTDRVESHGHYRLKGLEAPVELFEIGVPGRAPFAPPADTDKAYRVVRPGDLWFPLREVRNNLPGERDAFVGRDADLRRSRSGSTTAPGC